MKLTKMMLRNIIMEEIAKSSNGEESSHSARMMMKYPE